MSPAKPNKTKPPSSPELGEKRKQIDIDMTLGMVTKKGKKKTPE